MKYIFIFLITLCNHILWSQTECEYIKLCSQAEVDAFPQKYNHCNEIFSIEIDDNCNWVYNLDSLYKVEELGELIIQRMDSLTTIQGLNNLKKVRSLRMVQRFPLEPFLNLDTITFLRHVFGRSQFDLSIYKNINHIDSALRVFNSGILTGLPSFTCSGEFNLTVYENKIKNETSNLIPSNVSNISSLVISRNDSLSLNGCDKFQKIKRVIIDGNKFSDFTALNDINAIEYIQIGTENYNQNYYGKFEKIDSLKMLSLYDTENLKNINVIFPYLKSVTSGLILRANKHLVDIHILDTFDIPKLPPTEIYDPKQRLLITDNPFLADCISPYICKALETYPDSVLIQNNGPNCEKAQLIQDCLTSSDQEELTQTISFFPNPVFDKLYWNEGEVIQQLDIFNLSGKILYSIKRPSSGLDISHLDSGVYLVKMQIQNQSFTSRICVVK